MAAGEGEAGKLKPGERQRLRILIETTPLVRRGEVIDDDVAEERSRNMVTIVEAFFELIQEDS